MSIQSISSYTTGCDSVLISAQHSVIIRDPPLPQISSTWSHLCDCHGSGHGQPAGGQGMDGVWQHSGPYHHQGIPDHPTYWRDKTHH